MSRNSLLCPNCRRLISRNVVKCPYCHTAKPGSWLKSNRLTTAFSNQDSLITIIIAVNVGFYILSLLLNLITSHVSLNPLNFFTPNQNSLAWLGATGTRPILQYHHWWSLLTANYLHGGLLHILFNMMALRNLGPLVIKEYGTSRMLSIYTLGGVGGFAISVIAGIPFTIGASAAVCSLVGALLYYGKSRGGTYGENIYRQVGGWAISIFIFGFIVPGINNWGHGGGMAAGAILAYLLGYKERNRENIQHKLLGTGCAVGTALLLAWPVVKVGAALLSK